MLRGVVVQSVHKKLEWCRYIVKKCAREVCGMNLECTSKVCGMDLECTSKMCGMKRVGGQRSRGVWHVPVRCAAWNVLVVRGAMVCGMCQ